MVVEKFRNPDKIQPSIFYIECYSEKPTLIFEHVQKGLQVSKSDRVIKNQIKILDRDQVDSSKSYLKDKPEIMHCPNCNEYIMTAVAHKIGRFTCLSCLVLGVLLPYGCCLAPFCLEGFKDAIHSCPKCKKVIFEHKLV